MCVKLFIQQTVEHIIIISLNNWSSTTSSSLSRYFKVDYFVHTVFDRSSVYSLQLYRLEVHFFFFYNKSVHCKIASLRTKLMFEFEQPPGISYRAARRCKFATRRCVVNITKTKSFSIVVNRSKEFIFYEYLKLGVSYA